MTRKIGRIHLEKFECHARAGQALNERFQQTLYMAEELAVDI